MNAKITSRSQEETRRVGARLSKCMRPGEVVFLQGDLGAGKSVMARGIAGGLGVNEPMPSPTFTLMQPYQGKMPVYHFDLYRLESPEELYEAGLDEFLFGDGVSLVEWPQNALEEDCATIRIYITVCADGRREISVQIPDGRETPEV